MKSTETYRQSHLGCTSSGVPTLHRYTVVQSWRKFKEYIFPSNINKHVNELLILGNINISEFKNEDDIKLYGKKYRSCLNKCIQLIYM